MIEAAFSFYFLSKKISSVLFQTKYFSNYIYEKCMLLLLGLLQNSFLRTIYIAPVMFVSKNRESENKTPALLIYI
jgi:hypothetical protein